MAPSSFTPNERLVRKRLAARLRQRRCRERKRELSATSADTDRNKPTKNEEATSSKTTPIASPSKVTHLFVDMNQQQQMKQYGYHWTYPVIPHMPPHGYPIHGPPLVPTIYPRHHPYAHPYMRTVAPHNTPYEPLPQVYVPFTMQAPEQHEAVSRTVSRSPSDASMSNGKAAAVAVRKHIENTTKDLSIKKDAPAKAQTGSGARAKKQRTNQSLMSTEKAAVDAMLSMKSNSSDESDDDTSSRRDQKLHPDVRQLLASV